MDMTWMYESAWAGGMEQQARAGERVGTDPASLRIWSVVLAWVDCPALALGASWPGGGGPRCARGRASTLLRPCYCT